MNSMVDQDSDSSPEESRLLEIFARMKIKGLPAMSSHVRELISLTQSSQSAGYELAQVILKDYSLTNKVLQVVNSAYYSLGRHVNSISRAVTILGFDAVRELAMAIALFEDFVKSGREKELVSRVLTSSFLSAMQAREMAAEKDYGVAPEEAFICALLHNLGKIIICIYLPEQYQQIEELQARGLSEQEAARKVLSGLTFHRVGMEVAAHWNLSANVIAAMAPNPEEPKNRRDQTGYLRNLAAFTNRLTEQVCQGQDVGRLVRRFEQALQVNTEEVLDRLNRSVDNSEEVSPAIRFGLSKLKIRNNLQRVEAELRHPGKAPKIVPPEKEPPANSWAESPELPEPAVENQVIEIADPAADPEAPKSVTDFIQEITETLMGEFNINDFYINLLEGLYRGVGFDRVLLAIMMVRGKQHLLCGRFGFGDLDREGITGFRYDLASPGAIQQAVKNCRDLAVPPGVPGAFPEIMQPLVAGRTVYLLPVCLENKPIGLIYLDRREGRPRLDAATLQTTRMFRDFAVMAIRKLRQSKRR
ncbi:HDOD domain-containing protein [Desulfurivibrio alkaliphilus]|uniref:Putative signal transduction protein n=1 Tax=Desulfurivibrio alkaliphilus (strain DSM 19089 / UNIQEM U267 / AHT2) TaxID=589865 RepID=D6Z614_DESAT|nr:HDOD domain-containing protein [Desulfurivibrio alkaliphilus]ADH84896.1 putative signal transduction protein [Desulfurivibrio alkaliphilus AHT 2]